ncbi:MAG: DUF1800 family protein [Blastocatellia bacterium]
MAQPPTGYPETAEHWVNTGALLLRMNFALMLSGNRLRGTKINLPSLLPDPKAQPDALTEQAIKSLLNGEMSAQTRATLTKAIAEPQMMKAGNGPNNPIVPRVIALVLGSPEFQRQ